MDKFVKILIAEDLATDAELNKREILKLIPDCYFRVVMNREDFTKTLLEFKPDLVISDYRMPEFDGLSALKITIQLSPETPLIIVTGSINEEIAVDCMKAGAVDYVLKDSLKRLGQSVVNAIEQKEVRLKKVEAERRLKESEEEYRGLFNGMNDTAWIINTDGELLDVNSTAEVVLGFTREELLEIGLPGIDHNLKPGQIKTLAGLMLVDISQIFQTKHTTKDGRGIPVEISSSLIHYRGEKCILSIARDISQRLKAEEAIRESEEKFRHLFENHSAVKLIIDPEDLQIVEANEAAAEFYGWPVKKLTQMKISDINILPVEQVKLNMAKASSQKNIHVEFKHRKADGTIADVEVFSSKVSIGGKDYIHSIIQDITDKKRVLEELIASKEKAEESDRLKSTFLATMSHELRTPLNAIIGFSDLANEEMTKVEILELTSIVNSSGNHLLQIIEDLFDITFIESGQIRIEPAEVRISDLMDTVHTIIANEQNNLRKEHLHIIKTIPSSADNLVITTDQLRLKQILLNLLKNALKFTEHGSIEYGFAPEIVENKAVWQFYVKDTGIGIPLQKQELIFDVFRQADDSHTRRFGGVGIGLSISKKLAELLGGKIWVESSEGKGSCFYFTLPRLVGENKSQAQELSKNQEKSALDGEYSGKTILIAEDDDASFSLFKVYLKQWDVNVIRAKTGKEAVDICSKNQCISLVLMDVNLPELNGYEATKIIKTKHPNLPIIAQTAYAISGDRETAMSAGCDGYISKPINKEEFFSLVSSFLKN